MLHAVQLAAPALLKFGEAHAPQVYPLKQSLLLGVALLPPPLLKYPADTLEQLDAPPVLYLPPAHTPHAAPLTLSLLLLGVAVFAPPAQ